MYVYKKNLTEHLAKVHGKGQIRLCHVCGKAVGSSNMTKHMESHSMYKNRCPECGKEFVHKVSMLRHLKIHFTELNDRCDVKLNDTT